MRNPLDELDRIFAEHNARMDAIWQRHDAIWRRHFRNWVLIILAGACAAAAGGAL